MPGHLLTAAHLCHCYLLTQGLQLQGKLSFGKAHSLVCPLQCQKLQMSFVNPQQAGKLFGEVYGALVGPQAVYAMRSRKLVTSAVRWRPAWSSYLF